MTAPTYTEAVIDAVCAKRSQGEVARYYAHAISAEMLQLEKPEWPRINREILCRWKPSGLERIKKMAWRECGL